MFEPDDFDDEYPDDNTGMYFVVCENCFMEIAKHSVAAARLWCDLPEFRLMNNDIILMEDTVEDDTVLPLLERLGYIRTTDKGAFIMIRVMGHGLTDDGEEFFCIKGGQHDTTP